MPRRRAKRQPEQDAPARSGRALLAAGTIRSPGERESLAVTLSIGRGQVSLHADDLELGAWDEESVQIAPIDATSFAFTAEGDRMIFRPDDVISFTDDLGEQAVVTAAPVQRTEDAPKRRPRGRRRAKAPDGGARRSTSGAARERATPTVEDAGGPLPRSGETEPTPSRRTIPAVSMPKVSLPRVPIPKVSKPKDPAREASPHRAPPPDTRPSDGVEPSGGRPGLWLRTIDTARHQGWFSLDRIPVYEDQRGEEHDHTWNHRAVATSGLSRHVCTICGKIKLR